MNKELIKAKCIARINLLSQRDAEGNKGIIGKLKRKLRRIEG